MASWPLGAASAVCGAAPWATRLRMLGRSPIHMGILHSRYEESFSSPRPRRFVRLMLLPINSYFS
jgi:hypothetical protein